MNGYKIKTSFQINTDEIDDLESKINTIRSDLSQNGFFSTQNTNGLSFSRRDQMTTHSGQNKLELLNPIRKGLLTLEKNDTKLINAKIEINSTYLWIESFAIGFLVGLISYFYDVPTPKILTNGLISLIGFYIVGYFYIQTKVNNLFNLKKTQPNSGE